MNIDTLTLDSELWREVIEHRDVKELLKHPDYAESVVLLMNGHRLVQSTLDGRFFPFIAKTPHELKVMLHRVLDDRLDSHDDAEGLEVLGREVTDRGSVACIRLDDVPDYLWRRAFTAPYSEYFYSFQDCVISNGARMMPTSNSPEPDLVGGTNRVPVVHSMDLLDHVDASFSLTDDGFVNTNAFMVITHPHDEPKMLAGGLMDYSSCRLACVPIYDKPGRAFAYRSAPVGYILLDKDIRVPRTIDAGDQEYLLQWDQDDCLYNSRRLNSEDITNQPLQLTK